MVGRDDDSFGAALHVRVISARDIKVCASSSSHPSRIRPYPTALPSSSVVRIGTSESKILPPPLRPPQVSRVRIARLFATVEACGARFRSTGRVSTSSPVWDEAGVVPLTGDWRDGCARVIIWDRTLTSRPVRLGRCDVPLDRIGINDGMGEMNLSLVIRGAKGGGVHARGTVRVAMEVRTATDGGQDDETTSEECVEDGVEHDTSEHVNTISGANIDADAQTPPMENATAEGEVAGDGAATEPEPCTPANQSMMQSTTQSMISPVAASLAQSTASLRAYVLASGKLADAVESTPTFSAVRGGRRGWSARTPPRHPSSLHSSDTSSDALIPLSPVPVTEPHDVDSAMGMGRGGARRTNWRDGDDAVMDSARKALVKADSFVVGTDKQANTHKATGKTAGMEWDTEKGSIEEEEEGREVRRLAAVFARADRVFASWSL
jgi:hypothetical protein